MSFLIISIIYFFQNSGQQIGYSSRTKHRSRIGLTSPVKQSCGLDSSSQANSSRRHKTEAQPLLEQRIISLTLITILKITLSGKSLMYRRKSAWPRMHSCGTLALMGSPCKEFPSRKTRCHLLPRNKELGQKRDLKFRKT